MTIIPVQLTCVLAENAATRISLAMMQTSVLRMPVIQRTAVAYLPPLYAMTKMPVPWMLAIQAPEHVPTLRLFAMIIAIALRMHV